ncbi:hypothetical protein K458DRAFT_192774 [Lentithecium fluviatile CBS 122367]|uniref:T6SS Phospholipase effector Tle1-like catalytic domain-containing protein n=1 Tax=Lentithecium fluviatile CBS 122367 TaxID=1168545 RepID=A0A6G1IDK1_9PLEO|nr:hypothetical protein K458DRAFT_192774 [Lentithecium fluviatile CBS 122367]
MAPKKRLVLFCDGTWVGRETQLESAPASNIRLLATMVGSIEYASAGGKEPTIVHPIKTFSSDVVAGYQEGIGVNQTFLEYIWNGTTASTIGEECVSVYKFIVQHFTLEHEIWMFGFSRGSFTIRCVAGMINNCGIINKKAIEPGQSIDALCQEVYRTYRSPLDVDHPKSPRCIAFRKSKSIHQTTQPIRFMGLIDTVGGLGIPYLNAGVGISWPETEFHDQTCSSVVQTVYHAPALHERLWIFQPCLIFPSKDSEGRTEVVQRWFPGCHYDVGRQTFRFLRSRPWNGVEMWLGVLPSLLSKTIWPNQVLADAVLRWILEGVRATSPPGTENAIFPKLDDKIDRLTAQLANPDPNTLGSGDIYTDVLVNAGPLGYITGPLKKLVAMPFKLLDSIFPRFGSNIEDLLGVKTVVGVLTATKDRRVPRATGGESVYQYHSNERAVIEDEEVGSFSVAERADMGERYPSRTFETFQERRRVFGW